MMYPCIYMRVCQGLCQGQDTTPQFTEDRDQTRKGYHTNAHLQDPGLKFCTGGPDVIQKQAWPFYRTISGARLCWELEESKGPKRLKLGAPAFSSGAGLALLGRYRGYSK